MIFIKSISCRGKTRHLHIVHVFSMKIYVWIVHCFSHRSSNIFYVFSCFFEARFRDRFWTAFLMETATKTTSKIDHRGDPFDQKGCRQVPVTSLGSILEPTFFRASSFLCFLVPFRRPFGQCWGLLAPF